MAERAFSFAGVADGDLVTNAAAVFGAVTADHPRVVSEQASCHSTPASVGGAFVLTSDTTFSTDDQYCEMELVVHEDFEGALPGVMGDSSGNGYFASIRGTSAVRIRKLTTGTASNLTGDQVPASAFTAGDTLGIRYLKDTPTPGTCTLQLSRNGVNFGAGVTDAAQFTAGQPWIASVNVNGGASAARWDNFYAVDEDGGGDPAPSITNVNTTNTVSLENPSFALNGTDFDNTVPKATAEIRQGGFTYALTASAQDATSYTTAMPTIGAVGPISAPHAGAATAAIINEDAQEDTQAVTLSDEADTATVLIATPHATADLRLTASADAVAGDYVRISNVVGGSISDVTVNDDLTWEADEAVTAFDVQYWDAGDGTWGDLETQTNTAVVVEDTPVETASGGWGFLNHYDLEQQRRRKRKREQEQAEEAAQALPPVDREIARFLQKQEREDGRRKDLERLKSLATQYADERAERQISQRLADAFNRARTRQTISSLRNLERELRRMMEEEDMAVLMLMINADD